MATYKFKTVDEYISTLPDEVIAIVEELRNAIKQAIPQAEEVVSYNMPAFRYHGVLVYYAAFKSHIGFYPTPSAITAFRNELAGYENAKGSVKFPIEKPIPIDLIKEIVKFRLQENLKKVKTK